MRGGHTRFEHSFRLFSWGCVSFCDYRSLRIILCVRLRVTSFVSVPNITGALNIT